MMWQLYYILHLYDGKIKSHTRVILLLQVTEKYVRFCVLIKMKNKIKSLFKKKKKKLQMLSRPVWSHSIKHTL
jgi:hypothetical protein